ncbi:MAG TPA: HoxN/HupN/NixA family nickel/cobalt transporter [Thermoplasmata archaeon]|nr:HoxN/HupN/NixA family nickel/cobalt transporter [Thermoplasmata archaeon]
MSSPSTDAPGPIAEIRDPLVLSRAEWIKVVLIYAAIAVATAFGIYLTFWVGTQYAIFWALGILAYTLGLRHGVDADHICAIDNTTRKLIQQDKRPTTVGTWFSLGHSTIVVVMLGVLVVATRFIVSNLPAFEADGAVIGTVISGAFLYVIALINLLIFWEIYRIFRSLRSGALDQRKLDETLLKRGFMNRYFGKLFRFVNEPWQIYPIGVLFGLGFDTASEVALIAITVTTATAATHFPLWMVMVLPFMFTCGMVLTDTTDGFGMRFAYGWAFLNPIRKVYYNLTMTVISVLVAVVIGTIELLGVLAAELGLSGGPFGFWTTMNWLSTSNGPAGIEIWGWCGILIIVLFVGCWLVSIAVYRWKRIEEVGFGRPPAPPDALPSEPVPSSELV